MKSHASHTEPHDAQVTRNGRALQLLIVEDDPAYAAVLKLELKRAGFELQARQVASVAALRQALQEQKWDAVLSDHKLPGFSGREALELVQSHGLDIPFIVVTGTLGEQAAVEYMKAGAHDYLLKGQLTRLGPALRRELQEAENRRAHRKSEARYRHMVEAAAEGIWILDRDLRIVFANRPLGAMLGGAPEQLQGRSILEFLSAESSALARCAWLTLMDGGSSLIDAELIGLDRRKVSAIVSSTVMPDQGGLLGMVTDITERKRLEERVLHAEVEKKAFCREVLSAVTGGRFHLVDPEDVPELGQLVFHASLEQRKSFSQVRARLRELGAELGLDDGDVGDLVLASGEAITNAIKHAAGGYCRVYCGADRLVVRVSDQGSGIRPEDLPNMLQAGYSTKVSLGMGHTLMLELSDRIWLATGPEGTTVQLEKRMAPQAEEPPLLAALLERFGE